MSGVDHLRSVPGVTTVQATERAEALRRHEQMVLIRRFETKIDVLYRQGRVRGPAHLGMGQEAVAVGAAAALRLGDRSIGTYRGHAHALARGAPPDAVLRELLGREGGICQGKGGSMHITDVEHGYFGSYAIIGAHLPIACGMAWADQVNENGAVTVCFFGDGTTNIGAFHEALNFAAVWTLPMVFVCENNHYMEYTPISDVIAVKRPDVGGAVAEEADSNVLVALVLRAQRRAAGDRQMRADNRVGAHHAVLGGGEVHGAALAAHQAVVALHQLAQHLLHRDAARQRVGVAAIGAKRMIALLHRDAEAGRDRLLTKRQMARALHQVLQEQVVGALLGLPQPELRVVELEPHLLADVVVRATAIGRRAGRFPRHLLGLCGRVGWWFVAGERGKSINRVRGPRSLVTCHRSPFTPATRSR